MGMDPAVLAATVERFNGFCATGEDEDFQRGATAYDNYYGDPRVKPNPNLGTIEKGPFQAFKVVPGDLGTKGGLLTDEHARVARHRRRRHRGSVRRGQHHRIGDGPHLPGCGLHHRPRYRVRLPGRTARGGSLRSRRLLSRGGTHVPECPHRRLQGL